MKGQFVKELISIFVLGIMKLWSGRKAHATIFLSYECSKEDLNGVYGVIDYTRPIWIYVCRHVYLWPFKSAHSSYRGLIFT